MMFRTLAKVQHYIRTTYGDSTTTYSCIEIWFQGIYQGNSPSSGIWLLVSIPNITKLKAAGFGFKVQMVISGNVFSFVCYTFVHDSNVMHSIDSNMSDATSCLVHLTPGKVVYKLLEEGALVPSKSYWFPNPFRIKT
jgi:hypothetical protein